MSTAVIVKTEAAQLRPDVLDRVRKLKNLRDEEARRAPVAEDDAMEAKTLPVSVAAVASEEEGPDQEEGPEPESAPVSAAAAAAISGTRKAALLAVVRPKKTALKRVKLDSKSGMIQSSKLFLEQAKDAFNETSAKKIHVVQITRGALSVIAQYRQKVIESLLAGGSVFLETSSRVRLLGRDLYASHLHQSRTNQTLLGMTTLDEKDELAKKAGILTASERKVASEAGSSESSASSSSSGVPVRVLPGAASRQQDSKPVGVRHAQRGRRRTDEQILATAGFRKSHVKASAKVGMALHRRVPVDYRSLQVSDSAVDAALDIIVPQIHELYRLAVVVATSRRVSVPETIRLNAADFIEATKTLLDGLSRRHFLNEIITTSDETRELMMQRYGHKQDGSIDKTKEKTLRLTKQGVLARSDEINDGSREVEKNKKRKASGKASGSRALKRQKTGHEDDMED